jgi:DNA-binding beta-propeller fold protein YncE
MMKTWSGAYRQAVAAVAAALICAGPNVGSSETSRASSADYELLNDVHLGPPNFWDYLTYDPIGQRLYAAHVDKIDVIDVKTGKSIGQVGPLKGAHGVAIVPELGKGYAGSAEDGAVAVFSLADLHVLKAIKVSKDADGVIYDPVSRSVLIVAGDSKNLTVISADQDTVLRTVPLPGEPEFLAVDGHGHVFINIADKAAIAKVNIGSGSVMAIWPLTGCQKPAGLGYDSRSDRLFSGCANARLIVVDAATGRNLANLPIGTHSDAVVVDSARRRAFSANADGTLTVIAQGEGDSYSIQRTIPTFFGGRNMAIDEKSGTLYIAHGNMKLLSSTKDVSQLRFGWDGLDVAVMKPND